MAERLDLTGLSYLWGKLKAHFASKDTATTSAAGLMSSTDKAKLDGIASGAQVNSITGVKGGAESIYRQGNVNLTAANVGAPTTTGSGASGTWEISITGTATSLAKRFSLTKGTNPSSRTFLSNWFNHQTGSGTATADRIGGGIESYVDTNGSTGLYFNAYQYASGSTLVNRLAIMIAKDGTPSYSVTDQSAFRTAIGAAAASTHQYAFYSDISQLGLSGEKTVLQIFNALPNNSVIITSGGLLASDMPNTYGELMIVRTSGASRSHIMFYGKYSSNGTWRMYLGASSYNNNVANAPDGTWYRVYDGSTKLLLSASSAISLPASGASVSRNMTGLTTSHELIRWNFSDSPENVPPASLTWTTYNGYFTVTNNGGTTSESIRPVFALPEAVATTAR